jgi:hypothetical protein
MTFTQKAIEAAARALSTFQFGHDEAWQDHLQMAERCLTAALAVDGVCLVPKEPTKEMICAGCNSRVDGWNDRYYDGDERSEIIEWVKDDYRAMLAAASDVEERK